MKIGVLGSGDVAKTLAAGFLQHGYDVMMGTRDTSKLTEWKSTHDTCALGSVDDTARFGEILVLAVQGSAAVQALELVSPGVLDGKTIIDATNPIDSKKPPVNGVFLYFTGVNDSLMELLQRSFPAANFVKAFNSVGQSVMVNPQYEDGPPTMFICGNNESAKAQVANILPQFGWKPEDMGMAEAARPIESLCQLWCIRIFKGQDTHAFKLLT